MKTLTQIGLMMVFAAIMTTIAYFNTFEQAVIIGIAGIYSLVALK